LPAAVAVAEAPVAAELSAAVASATELAAAVDANGFWQKDQLLLWLIQKLAVE